MKNLDIKNDKIKIIAIIISAMMIMIFLYAAPSFISKTVLSENQIAYEQSIPSIARGNILSQQFIPQYDRIEGIEVYVNMLNCNVTQGLINIKILDENFLSIYENNIPLLALPEYGMTRIVKDIRLQSGNPYYITLETVDVDDDGPAISFYPTVIAASAEESGCILSYAGVPIENSVLRLSFYYSVPLLVSEYVVYCLFLFFSVCWVSEKIFEKKRAYRKV